MTARRIASVTAVGLIAAAQCCAPPAQAITPLPIDNSRLPAPALPAAPQSTEQRDMCAVPGRSRAAAPAANPLHALDLSAMWRLTRGEGQRVAVIDTGVNRHPRLAHLEGGGDYVATGDGTQDCDGHGTIVAGIIAAAPDPEDRVGFAGLAPAATVISIRQSSTKFGPTDDPSITGFGDVDTMAMAVRTAADLGATVINISSVACAAGALDDRALGAALAYAVDVKDVVVVAAAGNVGGASQCPKQPDDPELSWDTATVAVSPAWYDDYVLTVGAIGPDGSPSSFSLAGPWVDVAAPGEGMVSLNPAGTGLVDGVTAFDREIPISGTSYAAPVVSGLAALVRARFPELTARQVMERIEASAHRRAGGWSPVVGNGTIDPLAAISTESTGTGVQDPPTDGRPLAVPATHPVATGRSSHRIALLGAGLCAAVAAGALGLSAARSRRNLRRDVAGD
ncbi:type VII secretion system ESX-4 serine protease mycosin MycP4 [soil metagenome]